MAVEKETNLTLLLNHYFLEEYPADILKIRETTYKNKFLKQRINDIRITTFFYVFLMTSCLLQIICFMWPVFTEGDWNALTWDVIVVKLVVFILGCLSLRAWKRQLHHNEEFHAWALGNYSKHEPLYETLRFLNRKKIKHLAEAHIIVADWLKNRPSIIFLLLASGSVVSITKLPFWIAPENLNCFLLETAFSLFVLFVFCIPFSSWTYIAISNIPLLGKNSIATVFSYCLMLFLILFELPIFMINVFPKGPGFFAVCGIGILIFLFLICFFKKREKVDSITDQKEYKNLDLVLEVNSAIKNLSIANLSCKGQIDYLLLLLEQNTKLSYDMLISWENEAKTTHALEIIYELEQRCNLSKNDAAQANSSVSV